MTLTEAEMHARDHWKANVASHGRYETLIEWAQATCHAFNCTCATDNRPCVACRTLDALAAIEAEKESRTCPAQP